MSNYSKRESKLPPPVDPTRHEVKNGATYILLGMAAVLMLVILSAVLMQQ